MENRELPDVGEQQKRAYVYSGFSGTDHNIQLPGKPLSTVPIGTAWQPRFRASVTEEELFIQHHLLARPQKRGRQIITALVWIAAVAAYLTFAFTL